MIKSLVKHGNSAALIIGKPILDLLNITADTKLRIATDGYNLIISPLKDQNRGERRKWREICGAVQPQVLGEDAQSYITRTRNEAEKFRAGSLRSSDENR
ncbi:MAG: hypothetical protein DDT21_01699 [Syntrophomonadaceae bacterium]|nr:hypothetical protein [Bacillota bacterium]